MTKALQHPQYKNLDRWGRRTVSTTQKTAQLFDQALSYLCDELGLNPSKATVQATILYAQDCGLELAREKD